MNKKIITLLLWWMMVSFTFAENTSVSSTTDNTTATIEDTNTWETVSAEIKNSWEETTIKTTIKLKAKSGLTEAQLKWIQAEKWEIQEKKQNLLEEKKNNNEEIKQNLEKFRAEYWELKDYLKADLTNEEKETLKTLHEQFKADEKEILDSINTALETYNASEKTEDDLQALKSAKSEIADKLTELRKQYYESLKAFVDTDKVEKYEEFAKALVETMKENKDLRVENFAQTQELRNEFKEQRKEIRSRLSKTVRDNFIAKLDAISDENKETVYNKLLQNVAKKAEQIKSSDLTEKKKQLIMDVLAEVEMIVKEKLNELSVADEWVNQEDIIDELLAE